MSITLTDYTPALTDIPQERVLDARARLEADLKLGWPDLDVRPNSIFGDLFLTPAAYKLAGYEISAERIVSDFDLEQVAKGVIYNCDVVKAFLGNFAAVERENLKASGTIRLTFSASAPVTIDRGVLFLFGTDNLFSLRLPGPGALNVLAPGSSKTNVNDVVLAQSDTSRWVVDVPVIGVMPSSVSDGDAASISSLAPNLVSMNAVGDFDAGTPEETQSILAQRTRETFHSSSLATRGGAAAFVRKEFPFITTTSATISGDAEMLRDTVNALGIRDGRIDVAAKSKQAFITATQLVKLTFNASEDKFVGRLDLSQVPVKIDTIKAQAAPAVVLTTTILSQSADPVRAPLATAAYSNQEILWLVINMPRGGDTLPLVPTQTVSGVTFAYFEVTFRFDPGLQHVVTVLDSPEVKPVGVDVLTKHFLPCVLSQFLVEYVKPAGKQVNVTQARTEILDYFLKLGYPNIYVDSAIGDAMLYAGASGVKSITCLGTVQWSVAGKFLPETAPSPLVNLSGALSAAITPPMLTITSTSNLVPNFTDPNIGTGAATLVAAGKRNIGFILDDAALSFTEFLP